MKPNPFSARWEEIIYCRSLRHHLNASAPPLLFRVKFKLSQLTVKSASDKLGCITILAIAAE
jgi:hypothetical protein